MSQGSSRSPATREPLAHLLARAWRRVHQPRVVSATYSIAYAVLAYAGATALVNPPTSVEGKVGALAMGMLAGLLLFGGLIGSPAALLGIWWLERVAVFAVSISAGIYGAIVTALHLTATSGNGQLQLGFVLFVLLMQVVRWHRIRDRPYDPARHF